MSILNETNIINKAIDKVKNLGTKELTTKESIEMMKNLIKTNNVPIQKQLKPGKLIMFKYNAKDKSQVYDQTPFVMILSTTSKYMLGINFHWALMSKRQTLVQYIISKNSKNIRMKIPMKIKYKEIRSAVKSIGAFPVVRLYIRGRMSSNGVVVPDDKLMEAARMKTETFTKGKANSTTLWTRAHQKVKTTKRRLLK